MPEDTFQLVAHHTIFMDGPEAPLAAQAGGLFLEVKSALDRAAIKPVAPYN